VISFLMRLTRARRSHLQRVKGSGEHDSGICKRRAHAFGFALFLDVWIMGCGEFLFLERRKCGGLGLGMGYGAFGRYWLP
jgi:hypothetical protein